MNTFHTFFSVFVVEFEQVNFWWEIYEKKLSVSYFGCRKVFNWRGLQKIIICGLLLIAHLVKAVYFARYLWQVFYEFVGHGDTYTSDLQTIYCFIETCFIVLLLCSTINLVLNPQGFLLFLQGQPLKPSSGEYFKYFFFLN